MAEHDDGLEVRVNKLELMIGLLNRRQNDLHDAVKLMNEALIKLAKLLQEAPAEQH